jgi:hypothetical protein
VIVIGQPSTEQHKSRHPRSVFGSALPSDSEEDENIRILSLWVKPQSHRSRERREPSETDKGAVRDDPNLKGEFVISQSKIHI